MHVDNAFFSEMHFIFYFLETCKNILNDFLWNVKYYFAIIIFYESNLSPKTFYGKMKYFLPLFVGKEINNNNIRTWIHAQDLAALEKVLFEGEGHLLLKHASAHPKTRKFLESVPRLMVKYCL